MDISIIPALAGLTGAAIGGLTSGITSWFAQKTQSRVQLLAQKRAPRQELYKEFIEVATQCYADALQHEKPDIPGLVKLYGKIGRMRVLSSPSVLASAEQIGQKIINMYRSQTRRFLSCARWSTRMLSTFLTTSVKPAAQNSGRFIWGRFESLRDCLRGPGDRRIEHTIAEVRSSGRHYAVSDLRP